jgi:hypothetical protein
VCGSPIDCHYFEPERVYTIENGIVKRNDNNDAFGMFPEYQFLCSNDIEHEINNESNDFEKWKQEFIDAVIVVMDAENEAYNAMEG